MDFCIAWGLSPGTSYPKRTKIGDLQIALEPSGNIDVFNGKEGNISLIVCGNTSGKPGAIDFRSRDNKIAEAVLALDGSFSIVHVDNDNLVVVTDCGGSIPLFYGRNSAGVALGTRAHEVARMLGIRELDPISVVDFVANGTVCHPWTLHPGVAALPAAAVCRIGRHTFSQQSYWQPLEHRFSGDGHEWGSALHDTVEQALLRGIGQRQRIKVLFSGGEDSRAIAGLIPKDADCTLATVLNGHNREYRLAQQAARAMGRPLELVQRPVDFYREHLTERVMKIGSGWDVRHTHIFGPTAEPYANADVLLGGYASDTLFKTTWMSNVTPVQRISPQRLLSPDPDCLTGVQSQRPAWVRQELWDAVQERRWKHHLLLREIRPTTAGNWHTLWPLGGHRVAYGHYLSALRIGPRLVEPFLSTQAFRLAAEMPDEFRVDRRAFRSAFAPAMGLAGWLPTSSGRIPRIGGTSGIALARGLNMSRKIRDAACNYSIRQSGLPPRIQGPWHPDLAGFPINMDWTFTCCEKESLALLLSGVAERSRETEDALWMHTSTTEVQKLRMAQIGIALAAVHRGQ